MAIRVVCDRCGENIEGTTYYTIDIYATDIVNNSCASFETTARNITTNLRNMFGVRPCYCKRCIDSIERFIHNKSVEETKEGLT